MIRGGPPAGRCRCLPWVLAAIALIHLLSGGNGRQRLLAAVRPKEADHFVPTGPLMDQVDWYCRLGPQVFCNRCDFDLVESLIRSAFEGTQDEVVVFAAGVCEGEDLKALVKQHWFQHGRARVFGWEIGQPNFEAALLELSDYMATVRLFNEGVSDAKRTMQVVGMKEVTRLVTPEYEFGTSDEQSVAVNVTTVETLRWADFLYANPRISQVSYAVIDVEGHEGSVLRGMELERLADRFPLFQYKLGGAWVDPKRRSTKLTQRGAAKYLNRMGYDVYLIGAQKRGTKDARPILLPVQAELFSTALCTGDKLGSFIQGNALAVSRSVAEQQPWLADAIRGFLLAEHVSRRGK